MPPDDKPKRPTPENDGEPPVSETTGEFEVVPPPVVSPAPPPETPEEAIRSVARSPAGAMSRVILLGALGLVVLFVMMANPGNVIGLEELAASLLIVAGVIELLGVLTQRRPWHRYVPPAIAIIAGAVICIWPDETRTVVGYAIGIVLVVRGLIELWNALRREHERGANLWVGLRALILIALGALALLVPNGIVPAVVAGGAIILVARAVVALVYAWTRNENAPADLEPSDTYSVIAYWLSSRQMADEDIDHIEESVFLNRGATRDRVSRFAVLMFLSTAIATFGIAVDSTAVVIGAMLVAPLMTPILGVSAGLIHGRTKSTLFSTTVVAGGAGGSILLAWGLAAMIPNLPEVVQNGQVVSRTAPTLLDLAIAVAAGAAGAYGISRAERSDALPGVAVAIALVPPLAVVGITLHAGDYAQAGGALLLFLTNLFSIILMAGLVFIVVGYTSWSRLHYRRNRIRSAFAIVVLGVVLISIPLALTASSVFSQNADLRNASAAVDDWLALEFPDQDPRPVRVNTLTVDGDIVIVQLVGWEEPPDTDELTTMLTESMGRTVTSSVRWIEERLTGVAPPAVDTESDS